MYPSNSLCNNHKSSCLECKTLVENGFLEQRDKAPKPIKGPFGHQVLALWKVFLKGDLFLLVRQVSITNGI